MKIEQYIPNALTFANLCCGFLGIVNVIYGDLQTAGLLVFTAALFDLFDGLAARSLRVESKVGEQLDSFADMVSFGALPGAILVILLIKTHADWVSPAYFLNIPTFGLIGLAFPMGAAYRLAKFNLQEADFKGFYGVPCPAAGLLVASLPLILEYDLLLLGYQTVYLSGFILNPWVILGIMVIIPLLMVCNIPMMSLKLNGLHWGGQEAQIIFVLVSLVFIILLSFTAIPLIFLFYVMISLIFQKRLT